MNILVVEDEDTVAGRIVRLSKEILTKDLTQISVFHTLDDAQEYLASHPVDLLFLDLNLAGRDGFQLMEEAVAGAFHTIVISAYAERAIEAFEFGVLDFVAKPFTKSRLEKALSRYTSSFRQQQTKFIAIKRNDVIEQVPLDQVMYCRGANIYSEVVLKNGETRLHDKPLSRLQQLLPEHFERVHKSYIVNHQFVDGIRQISNNAELVLNDDTAIPISRNMITELKSRLV